MNFGDEERDAYEAHLKWLRMEASTQKKYYNEGIVQGKREIAQSLLKQGMSVEEICKITRLNPTDFAHF